MYLYEKNSQKEWKAYIFLGRVHFFTFFFQVQFWSHFFHFFSTFFFRVQFWSLFCLQIFHDFSLIDYFMFSRGWLKFPFTRISHQRFFGNRVVLDGLELSFLALSISAYWVLPLIRWILKSSVAEQCGTEGRKKRNSGESRFGSGGIRVDCENLVQGPTIL